VPDTYAQVRWWASSLALAFTGLVGGLLSFVSGEPIAVVLALFVIAVVASTGRLRARDEFRRGWRRGYESAVRTMLEQQAGRTPDVEVRAAVQGDPTPEPWDIHLSVVRVRSMP
jgi:hypothetical protein